MARVYATEADYQTYVGDDTETVSAVLLARASAILDEALIGVHYCHDDTTKMPTNQDTIDLFRDCVCSIIQWMRATGDDAGIGDIALWNSASIGSASYMRNASRAGSQETTIRIGNGVLPPATVTLLRINGIKARPTVYG